MNMSLYISKIKRLTRLLGTDGWSMSDALYLLDDSKTTNAHWYFDLFLLFLIFVSCFLYATLTYLTPGTLAYELVWAGEILLISIFTIEYLLRVLVSDKRGKYALSLYGLIDICAVAPFWLSMLFPVFMGLQFLRVLRAFKLYRFFHRYFANRSITKTTISTILVVKVILTMGTLLFVSSGLVYNFEAPHNPGINTFDDALYFSVTTVTTVGFGDITPVSQVGRWIVVLIVLIGGIFLIPVYMASLMRLYLSHRYKKMISCSTCGLQYHDSNAVHCKMCGEIIYQEYNDQ